ncbi:hypothetical protein [Hamadaea tsunoensis]|uniref:hypothetical protein n=1 Tax=Hamadaea tsunoensis TaxID=53368 RepID=UPI000401DE5B|nr:hypothetical protein [Hamadaea tsunoensis]
MALPSATRTAAAISGHLRGAPWLDETGRAAHRFDLVDHIELEPGTGTAIALVAPDTDPDRWYAVPLDGSGGPREGGPAFDALVVAVLRENRRITTARGGVLEFHGDPPAFEGPLPFDGGYSTNALSLVRLGGHPHVHKRYRVLPPDGHEPAALRRSRGGDCLPEYAGHYAYVSPAGQRRPVGLLYRLVEGRPLEDLLRTNLRTLWTEVDTEAAVRRHVDRIGPVLTEVGALVGRLHRSLATPAAVAYRGDLTTPLENVTALLLADERHPAAVRAELARRLAAAVPATRPPIAAGIAHGDLHLSHLLYRSTPDGWTVRAIDPSPAAMDPADPAYAYQTPGQDLVAVQRSLESFAAHEAAVETGRLLGVHRREVCRAAVGDLLPGSAVDPVRAQVFATGRQWTRIVVEHILAGYRTPEPLAERGRPQARSAHTRAAEPNEAWWRALYLQRMLHELAYNYAHRRHYQVDVDLRHAGGLR